MEGVFFISFYETMLLQQKQLQQKLTDIQKQLQQLIEQNGIAVMDIPKPIFPKTRNLMPLSSLSDVIFWKNKRNIKKI